MIVEKISEEAKYHTILVMRTKQAALARQFPHTIFTLGNKISYDPIQKEEAYQFNVQIDAVRYKWAEKQIILANFGYFQQLFQEKCSQLSNTQHFTHFDTVKNSDSVEYFLYTSDQMFFKVKPLAIIRKSLLFVLTSEVGLLVKDQFKDIKMLFRKGYSPMDQSYYFSSQFGLLSDKHFVNNFVRGYTEFSSYIRQAQQGLYKHYIHPELHQTVTALLSYPKL